MKNKNIKYLLILFLLIAIVFVGRSFVQNKKQTAKINQKIKQRTVASAKIDSPEESQELAFEKTNAVVAKNNFQKNNANNINPEVLQPEVVNEVSENQVEQRPMPTESHESVEQVVSLLLPPQSLTEESYSFDYNARKYPVRLAWTKVEGADSYEVEIWRDDKIIRKYFKAMNNKFDIMIFPEKNYQWRVLAYKNNNQLTGQSDKFQLSVNVDNVFVSEADVTESESASELLDSQSESDDLAEISLPGNSETSIEDTSNSVSRVPASETKSISLWGSFWSWVGAGSNATSYEQGLNENSTLTYDTIKYPSFSGAAGVFVSDKIAVELTGGISLGDLDERDGLFDEKYTWSTYGLEALYLLGSTKNSQDSSWYVRAGAKYHLLPLLETYPSAKEVSLLSNNILALSVGIGKRTAHSRKFRSDIGVSYQHPFSAVTNESDYQLTSSVFVNTHLNLYYNIFSKVNLGLYWQGQFFLMQYELSNGSEAISGNQTLLNNKLGIFLGFDF